MTIEYEYTVDDYLALAQFARKRLRRQWFWWQLSYSLLIGLLTYGLLYIVTGYSVPVVAALSLPVVVAFYFMLPSLNLSHLRSLYTKKCEPTYTVVMEVVSDGLVVGCGHNETKTRWDGLGDVLGDGDHTFIYYKDGNAQVIPHRRITRGNYILFMQELARRLEEHTLAPLATIPSTVPAIASETMEIQHGKLGA